MVKRAKTMDRFYSGRIRPRIAKRKCLKCSKSFDSTGPGNRICTRCVADNAAQSGIKQCHLECGFKIPDN